MTAPERTIKPCLALAVLVFAALGCVHPAFAGEVTLSFVSDESWAISSMLPDGGVGDPLGTAQCVCRPPEACTCCWTNNTALIPGACWVWKPGTTAATTPVDLQGMYLERTFDIPGSPDSGILYLAADDFAELRVNGVVVGSVGSITDHGSAAAAQASLTMFDVTAFLVPGLNDVVIRSQNGPASFSGAGCNPCTWRDNPAGVLLGGTINYSTATPVTQRTWGQVKTTYR